MSSPFVAEIRIFAGNFAPKGWAMCNGQIMPISQNTALFSLLGTMYGGDGRSNFALPNLQGAAPLQAGQGNGLSLYDQGQSGGEQTVTLLTTEMPAHSHAVNASTASGTLNTPQDNVWAKAVVARQGQNLYDPTVGTPMSDGAVSMAGGGQPHNNMPPFLALTFIIALQGVFPPRS